MAKRTPPKSRRTRPACERAARSSAHQPDSAPPTAAPGHQGGSFGLAGNWAGRGMFGFNQHVTR